MALSLFTKSMAVLFMTLSLKFYRLPKKPNRNDDTSCEGDDVIIKTDGGGETETDKLTSTF